MQQIIHTNTPHLLTPLRPLLTPSPTAPTTSLNSPLLDRHACLLLHRWQTSTNTPRNSRNSKNSANASLTCSHPCVRSSRLKLPYQPSTPPHD